MTYFDQPMEFLKKPKKIGEIQVIFLSNEEDKQATQKRTKDWTKCELFNYKHN